MHELRKALYQTSLMAGLSIINEEQCAKLLSWVYVFGSYHEEPVLNKRMNSDIFYAKKLFNIHGGYAPTQEALLKIKTFSKEAIEHEKNAIKYQWVIDIYNKYNIQIPLIYKI